ncbi:hypothetical protein CH379_014575 [Leptospira ellisii]|uniref:Lipoprotein n=1 Tax=Leptospira ellisii TaxID=2023197 RepID=A0AAE4QQN6_9LEPT|nr:hypothetical protein [Leptospira ellisii]MDV6236851.1 hypothetical protein [Leptospira ellisii]PKA02610.1 hypothetical protein CH375_21960 [Leptospira ellisii]
MKKKATYIKTTLFGVLCIGCVTYASFAKEADKKEPEKNSSASSKPSPVSGCCRIKMTGGGFDYFVSTEEECASHKQFHSFLKERTLCFESFPE